MELEERARLLTEQLMALDQVKGWKRIIQKELAHPQYSVEQLQSLRTSASLENPLLHCLLEKMGLLGRLKRSVIDLHCEAVQTAVAASKKQPKHAIDDGHLLPSERTLNGCNLDVVRAARDNWEKITSDEMLRVASELRRPMIAPKAPVEMTIDDGQVDVPSSDAEPAKPAKQNRMLSTRFLYDGCGWLDPVE
ncbi:hypothetical protein P3T76_003200 [Phytophthora citrophthora]|uniref:Uncharacterized protein n=1 Tax=Phytophthora citrophthora TaxID=4793 RepID=A0AAD9GWT7_9STRA|nr:hypothetical protein P3T76_003200 [Phytophthora citrophthora]